MAKVTQDFLLQWNGLVILMFGQKSLECQEDSKVRLEKEWKCLVCYWSWTGKMQGEVVGMNEIGLGFLVRLLLPK